MSLFMRIGAVSFSLALLLLFDGCRKSPNEKQISFVLVEEHARSVFLAGSFSGWNTTSTPLHRNARGWWQVNLPFAPGYYSYKFIVDGHWQADPANTRTEPNGFGGGNSLLTINPGIDDGGPAYKERIAAEARRLFLADDFSAIEKRAAELRETRERTPDGIWKLALFDNGLNASHYAGDGANMRKTLSKFDAWHAQFPQSMTEPPCRALTLVGYAWAARGSDFAINPGGAEPFQKHLQEARAVLEEAVQSSARSPDWWFAMQNVALGQNWNSADYEKLFKEAIHFAPTYYDFYFAKAYWLLPRWNGRPGEWEQFAADADAQHDGSAGLALYARIARSNSRYLNNFFSECAVPWPKLREKFRDLVRQCPDSFWNLDGFCNFACLAGDRATAHELFAKVGHNYTIDLWQRPGLFQGWKRWADPGTATTEIQPLLSCLLRSNVALNSLAYLPDWKRVVTGSSDGSLDLWDVTTGARRHLATLPHWIAGLAVAPNEHRIAVATEGTSDQNPGAVLLVDADSGQVTPAIENWHHSAFAVAFSPDGSTLAAVGGKYQQPGEAKSVGLTNKGVHDLWPPLRFAATSIAYSPDGHYLAGNNNANIRLWDVSAKKVVFDARQPLRLPGTKVAFSPDGKWLACAYSPNSFRDLEGAGVAVVSTTDGILRQPLLTTPDGIHALAFSRDGRYLAGGGDNSSIYLWDAATGKLRHTFLALNGIIGAIAFAPDSHAFAASTNNGKFTVWRVPNE